MKTNNDQINKINQTLPVTTVPQIWPCVPGVLKASVLKLSVNWYPWSGLKIVFLRWPVMLTGQTNFSSVMSHFWPVKILKILIFKNFPSKPKISPHMHKKVLLKSILNVFIARSITYFCSWFAFPQAVGSHCILLDM